ncbi:pyridoxal-phosphate dependent enzyme [Microbulbifer bruguierae]|uniref:Pyridoxal-phosphate dependent enzyme n=1 Tax=Microbulbifer bruguierae TaxID=3029061 RepID=A0ABY8NGW9_9GAMM|nr:pyridoxal-phosphate dependent enzyme [Microbulbifer bruguierae]WGL17302.1 pyridoxal-phosphate dependent enzyme [Microbulbifer bruguierae]
MLAVCLFLLGSKMQFLSNLDLRSFKRSIAKVPYQCVSSDVFPGVDLWVRRDDLLDPLISGNKGYKLIFNLLEARRQNTKTLITCGGAWSNHIHATAAAGQRFGFRTVGIIRGEAESYLSATLQDARRMGMQLHFVSRAAYRERHRSDFPRFAGLDVTNSCYIPEGGANLAGARGVGLLGAMIQQTQPIKFAECWVACGTGLTLGALGATLGQTLKVVGVSVLKDRGSVERSANFWRSELDGGESGIDVRTDYHCGGYARYPVYLDQFRHSFQCQTGIPLDPIYTAKLAYALQQNAIEGGGASCRRRKVLMLHTGGLQGVRGDQ